MSTHNDEVRVIEYWPTEDERRIVAIKRSPEVDAMTDEELISRRGAGSEARLVTHEDESGHRSVAVVRRSPENDKLTHEEIVAKFTEWQRSQRHLRAVDDPE
ncbi:hypothetical protein [Streptomyces longhuiensis]|uniref:hypothetical protein n=1 Tax=Streptomyces longhuiensis TaxID=2880933 RepID=UPI001D0B2A63|nr:hypothetical protein [Streptomyces longhuiensis]UDM00054.1 hypothetical protein LGI35_18095 [Streptomyces longhuiensis]